MAEAGKAHTGTRLPGKDKAPGHAEIIDISGNAMVKCSCGALENAEGKRNMLWGGGL